MPRSSAFKVPAQTSWLAETVRRAEERWGPYEDSAVLRDLRASTTPESDTLRLVVRRNVALAEREGLDEVARHWRGHAVLVLAVMAIMALVFGWGAARGALGDALRPVNLFWALGGLLGLHVITFVVWALALLMGRKSGLVGRLVVGAAGRLTRLPRVAAIGQRLAQRRPPAASLLPAALAGLLQRARLQQPLLGLLSHGWWLLALMSALATLVVLFSTRRYEFVWETTLLSPQAFVNLTDTLAALPSMLGFRVPDAELVRASDGLQVLTPADQAVWSTFLLGCVVLYGIMPRALVFIICGWLIWRRRGWFSLDFDAPSWVALRERLASAPLPMGVVDADTSNPTLSGPASAWAQAESNHYLSPDLRRHGTRNACLIAGVELPDTIAWPPAWLPEHVLNAGNIDERHQRNALLELLAQQPPARLLIVCDAHQTPDRGTLALVTELAQRAEATRFLLMFTENSPHRADQWRERLHASYSGQTLTVDSETPVLDAAPEAAQWLKMPGCVPAGKTP